MVPGVTNYGGGNTSVKAKVIDPVTGQPVGVLVSKGSGGDLGALRFDGLATLLLERVLALRQVYPGPEREDGMVTLLEQCRFGAGGAAPSIDTPLHALLPPIHVDHVHPDHVIALATAADAERLIEECYGGHVAWLPWRRPGFELAIQMAALYERSPGLQGIVLGGHGLVAWGDTSGGCEARTLELVAGARRFLEQRGRVNPLGTVRPEFAAVGPATRKKRAANLATLSRRLCSAY